jgi:hypothetical protein
MSVMKFVNEQGPEHGGNLVWPGINGIPVRGTRAPLLRDEEIDTDYELQGDFHCQEFNMSDVEDRKQYMRIMDRVAAAWYIRVRDLPWRDPATGRLYIYLEWVQKYNALNSAGIRKHMPGSSIPLVG